LAHAAALNFGRPQIATEIWAYPPPTELRSEMVPDNSHLVESST